MQRTLCAMAAPARDEYDDSNCSIARTLAVLGDRWTLLVLREAFNGVRRFEDLQGRLGVARDVLTARLNRLVDEGVLERVPYREPGQRRRHEYRLTPKGLDAYPILVALLAWGDRHQADAAGPALELVHADCGGAVRAELRCEHGHAVDVREVRPRPGPGARRRVA
jgi:DNA-binding HxlR family transcriptional regulator